MNEHDRDTLFALVFGLLGVVCLLLMSCAKLVPKTGNGTQIREVHSLMQHHFRVANSMTGVNVRSYADEIEAGQRVVGVCSHYALTAADLLKRRGVEAEVWLVEDRHGRDHMVAVGAGTWVLDVNEAAVWSKGQFNYVWVGVE